MTPVNSQLFRLLVGALGQHRPKNEPIPDWPGLVGYPLPNFDGRVWIVDESLSDPEAYQQWLSAREQ